MKTPARKTLGSALGELISECSNVHGYIPNINQTLMDKCNRNCIILSNKASGKVALMGNMIDKDGKRFINAYMVNIWKWNWASDEGFTIDNIFGDNVLCDDVFSMVSIDRLPLLLK